jgi:tRNA(Ile)-lysidine synthase
LDLQKHFTEYIQQNQLFQPADRLLLAVSGGADSLVLAWLIKKAGYAFGIAHCNFQLRGEESSRDEAFVTEIAKTLEVPLFVKRFETRDYAEEKKISIQVAARELRYEWFKEILEKKDQPVLQGGIIHEQAPFQFIVTAHHRDDNIETVLMNFCKGTGIRGLKGMLPRQDKIVRPLLFAAKEEILVFAQNHQLSWIEDSSNEEIKYTRNYFRKVVIPAIEKIYPHVQENVANSINRFQDTADLYNQAVARHKKRLLETKGNMVQVPVLKLLKSSPRHTLIYEIIKNFGFTPQQVAEVEKLLTSESGKYCASSTHRILRNRAWLLITSLEASDEQVALLDKEDASTFFDQKVLQLNWLKDSEIKISTNNSLAVLDASEIRFPLIIRKWKAGDYFYPLGMKKKKKLSRFFIDQRLSLVEKEKVWVVESSKKIVWVIGLRIDDRFKVTDTTRQAIQLSTSNL